jgi:hypothetical protein
MIWEDILKTDNSDANLLIQMAFYEIQKGKMEPARGAYLSAYIGVLYTRISGNLAALQEGIEGQYQRVRALHKHPIEVGNLAEDLRRFCCGHIEALEVYG